jgi:glycosyltransferase involved in cell wall biosynthesis
MNKILTICIPTYNRSEILNISLKRICSQLQNEIAENVCIFVSDNCSHDSTKDVVLKYINEGYPIVYNRNEKNLGSNGNFQVCFRKVDSKYMWLLGDDDFIFEGSISYILKLLEEKDYGHLYLKMRQKDEQDEEFPSKTDDYIKSVSFMFTFMSAHIINTSNIKNAPDSNNYLDSWLIHIPFYINAAKNKNVESNIIINRQILDPGHASSSNGGFNYFEVTVKNYLKIIRDMAEMDYIEKKTYLYMKRDHLKKWLVPHFYQYVILRKLDANYDLTDSWNYLFAEYKHDAYFYIELLYYPFKLVYRKMANYVFRPNSK